MNHRKQPERRTFLQDRLEILIKRQRNGTASFNELTELDDIVNSDPEIMKRIIMESMFINDADRFNDPVNTDEKEFDPQTVPVKSRNLLRKIRDLVSRIFTSQISAIKITPLFNNGVNAIPL